MKLSRRDFVKGVGAGAALAGLSSLAVGEAQAAPARPGGREVLPIPDIQQPYPSALYGKDVQPTPAKPLRPPEGAPNVVIILIDDMGFGASSAFGGPINMPTLERVANEGLKYTRFHTTALCSPTRQALLTGRNHHSVGMGSITETATTAPGYNSIRPNTAATIPETLRLNGYSTAAFGKMHQTPVWEVSASGPFDRWPTGDGFEDFYGFVGAETNQWAPTLYQGTKPVEPPNDPDYHLTPDLVNHAIEWVQAQHALTPDKPFFVYLSFGATHAPHHVPPEWSDKYKGKFDQGWDTLRETTLANQKKLGVVPQDCQLTARSKGIPAWADLTDDGRKVAARLMEIYAGFAEHTDHYAGVLLDALEEMGVLDNTLLFYMAGDNGASAEGTLQGTSNEMIGINLETETLSDLVSSIDEFGTVQSYNHYPVGWAHAMNCPYQWTKQVASHWGGTRNGMAVRWPKGIKAKRPGAQPVAPRHRHRANHPRSCRAARARTGARRDPEADRGREHELHLRRRQGRRPPRHPVLRDVRQPRHLPPGLERGGAAPHPVRSEIQACLGGRRLGAVRRQHGLEPGGQRGGQEPGRSWTS